jgi:hypothetical protein
MEDSFKNIKIVLDYYDENAVRSEREMTIKVNKIKDVSFTTFHSKKLKYSMSLSLTLPNHIHSFILGKTVPSSTSMSNYPDTEYPDNFSKTINKDTLEKICDTYLNILDDYKWLKEIENAKLQKVIFYDFENSTQDYRSERNSLVFGQKQNIGFKYSIGYISESNDKILRYNYEKLLIRESNDRLFYKHKYVVFTEERNVFFDGIKNSFESVIKNINTFEESLSEDKINEVISGGLKLIS